MKPLAYIALLAVFSCGVRAEVFKPPLASGRGFHQQTPGPGARDRGHLPAGRGRGPGFGYSAGWYHRGGFRWSGVDLVLGLGPWYYDDWHRWPWWYDGPVYETAPVMEYAVAPVASGPVGSTVIMAAGSDLRDARSPEQLKAIFGEQAAGLTRGD